MLQPVTEALECGNIFVFLASCLEYEMQLCFCIVS